MKKRIVAMVCALAMLATSQSFAGILTAEAAPASEGTSYYFSNDGDNSNSGTSENEAWQTLNKLADVELEPGDQILLEKGSVFHGYIHLQDVHGTADAPIRIAAYGEGNKPIINANGEGVWYQDYATAIDNSGHRSKGYVSSAILLYDVDFVEVDGLEITNQSDDLDYIQNGINNISARMDRTGVSGVTQNGGTMQHVYLNDLYIHDIDGNLQDKHMNNGGIQMNAYKPDDEAATGIARYDDIRITNCHIKDVHRAGLVVGYTYQHAKFNGNAIADDTAIRYGHTNIYIAGNYIQNSGNDGLVAMYSFEPVVERNVCDSAGVDLALQISGYWQSFCCGIWPWKTKDAVFQYNEAFDTVGLGNGDGQAWDVDWSDGTVYQYNYSHNNGGGSMLICLNEAYNSTFRYNLSYNDLACFITFQGNPLAKIYNNVFYVDGDRSTRVHHSASGKRGGVGVLYNNIFYNASTANPNDEWEPNGNKTFSNNLYYGYTSTPSTDKNAIVISEADKDTVFAGPLTAPTETTGVVTDHDTPNEKTPFDGFKLAENSPAINKGIYVGGGLDFFGNKLGLVPDIGIHETDVPSDTVPFAVYSDEYTVEDGQISDVEAGTKVALLLQNLIYDERVTVKAYNGTAEAAGTDYVTNDTVIKATYNGEELSFTVAVELKVSSSAYSVGSDSIREIVEGTTAGELKASLNIHNSASATVYDGTKAVADHTEITDGMTLRVEILDAEDVLFRVFTLHTIKSYAKYSPDGMTATAGSIQPNNSSEGDANFALDDNTGTLWHTNWNGCTDAEKWILIDMGEEKDVAMLEYTPRTSGKNGIITKYEIWAGDSEDTLEKVTEGSWENDNTVKYAYFTQISARYIELVATESTTQESPKQFVSAAEIRLGYEN